MRQQIDCGGHTFFVGEIVNADFQKAEDTRCFAWRTPA